MAAQERRPQHLGGVEDRVGPGRHPGWRERGGGGGVRRGEGTGSGPLITPKPPKGEGDSGEQGWEQSGGLPTDWEGPGEPPKLKSLSPAENHWVHPPNTVHPQLPGQNPRKGVG